MIKKKRLIFLEIFFVNIIFVVMSLLTYLLLKDNLDNLIIYLLSLYFLIDSFIVYFIISVDESKYIRDTYYFELEKIPNQNILKTLKHNFFKGNNFITISVFLVNHEEIIRAFEEPFFFDILNKIFDKLKTKIKEKNIIISNNVRRILMVVESSNYEEIIDKVIEVVEERMVIDNIPIKVEYNIGYCIRKNVDDLITKNLFSNANIASTYAFVNNKKVVCFNDIKETYKHDYNILKSIPKAIRNNELYFNFQPIIPKGKDEYLYLEMLVRWVKDNQIIMPDQFIPYLEHTLLINDLSLFVLKSAIKEIKEYLTRGFKVSMSINLSVSNFKSERFINEVIRLIKESKLNPRHFEFEITEGSAVDFSKTLFNSVNQLKSLGIRISIDDFGAGFSSMGYFSKMPIDYIKIDRDITKNINKDENANSLVRNLTKLLHDLGYEVVIEGIENSEQFDFAVEVGIDYFQGYFITKPLDKEKILRFVEENYHKYVK